MISKFISATLSKKQIVELIIQNPPRKQTAHANLRKGE